MTSEWEMLEGLTKDELLIELARERFIRREINRQLRMMIDCEYPVEREPPYLTDYDDFSGPGERTTEEWARKVILHACSRCGDPDGVRTAIFDYGLDWDQADEVFDRMAEEGILDWPSYDPRSRRFSGIVGKTAGEVEAMTPDEREEYIHR